MKTSWGLYGKPCDNRGLYKYIANTERGVFKMFTNKADNGRNNNCGEKIKNLRLKMKPKTSQRALADMLIEMGLQVNKNTIQKIETGERFVTDVELKYFKALFGVTYEDLLGPELVFPVKKKEKRKLCKNATNKID